MSHGDSPREVPCIYSWIRPSLEMPNGGGTLSGWVDLRRCRSLRHGPGWLHTFAW
jgi:hypothetical protein